MLIEHDAQMRSFQQVREQRFTLLDWMPPQILAVELKQVERAMSRAGDRAVASDWQSTNKVGLILAYLRRIISPPAWGAFTMMGNAMNNHKFKVGQTVNYAPRLIAAVNADAIFKITQLLPL